MEVTMIKFLQSKIVNSFSSLCSTAESESGKIGYLVLYLLGAPVGILLLLWVVLGNNLLTTG